MTTTTRILDITGKTRSPANTVVSLTDFEYTPGDAIAAASLLDNHRVTLYCLDLVNQQAIFTEGPADLDLTGAPFYYLAQYQQAQRLIAMPLAEFGQLAWQLPLPKHLMFLYSVGRCGSTLLSQVFHQVDTCLSLSEPDVFSQLVAARNPNGSRDPDILALIQSSLRWLCRPALKPEATHCLIKLRSFGIELADLIHRVVPQSQTFFLYRHGADYVKSALRAFGFLNALLPSLWDNLAFYQRFVPLLPLYASQLDNSDHLAVDVYTIAWLSVMDRYLFCHRQGIFTAAIRYEDLIADTPSMMERLWELCDITSADVQQTCQVFAQDSQRGTNLARSVVQQSGQSPQDTPPEAILLQRVQQILDQHPEIKTADFRVPGTV